MDDTQNTPIVVETAGTGLQTEIDKSAEDAIKAIANQFKAEKDAEIDAFVAGEGKTPGVEPKDVPDAAKVAAEVKKESTSEPIPPLEESDRGLARLVEREVALRERETAIKSAESRLADMERRFKALEARAIPEDVLSKMEYEPEAALKHLGLDPEHLVRQVIANRLGKDATPEMRQSIEFAQMKKKIAAQEQALAEHQRRVAEQQYVAEIHSGAREYVNKGVSEKDTPVLSTVAKANPDRVFREIMDEIAADARVRAAQDPYGQALPYSEAAKRVEARWAEFKSMIAPASPETKTNTQPQEIAPKPAQPTTSKVVSPPDRPRAPWLERRNEEEDGIRAALAAFRQSESSQG